MITEQRICVICETPFTAKAYNKSDLRKTCCSKCAAKLTKINMNKNKPNLIKGKPLKEHIEDTIQINNLTTCRPKTIVYFNPVLRALDSHSLRSKIGRVLANDLGYTKISKKAYQKL